MSSVVSIIIPALDEAEAIAATLAVVTKFENVEIIVADGGSVDETAAICQSFGISVVQSARGRGAQMHAGARAATGAILWFLHADTIPDPESIAQMRGAFDNSQIVGGNFAIRFDGASQAARFLSWLYPQLRKINLIYGDSGIFVRQNVYHEIGGFRPFPIFEDLDFVRRMQQTGRLIHLPGQVVTSSRRFENRSFARTFLRWAILQLFYWLGVSPETLARFYAPLRHRKNKREV